MMAMERMSRFSISVGLRSRSRICERTTLEASEQQVFRKYNR